MWSKAKVEGRRLVCSLSTLDKWVLNDMHGWLIHCQRSQTNKNWGQFGTLRSQRRPVRHWLQKVCWCCPSSTRRSLDCSRTTDCWHDSSRTNSQTLATTNSLNAIGYCGRVSFRRLLRYPWHLTPLKRPQLNCACKKAAQAADVAWKQTVRGHNGPTITNPTIPDVGQSGLTSHPSTITICPTSKRSTQARRFKHKFPDCQTEPEDDVYNPPCWPKELGYKWQGSRIWVTRMSHTHGFITETRVQAVSWHCTTSSQTRRKDWAIGAAQAAANAVDVDHS